MTHRRVCVFCGAASGNRPEYTEAARELGRELALRGWGVVYGGATIGLMGAVADAALEAGGEVIGVLPEVLTQREIPHNRLTQLILTSTMHERKAKMADLSEIIIALPGGFGTLDELFETLTWNQLKIIDRPIGLLDVGGFFQPLLRYLDTTVEEGFLRQHHRDLLIVDNSVKSLLSRVLPA